MNLDVVIMQCSGNAWCMLFMSILILIGLFIMVIYFTAGDENELNMGPGDDLSIVKKSSELHLIEVDNSGSTGVSPGWVWLELV